MKQIKTIKEVRQNDDDYTGYQVCSKEGDVKAEALISNIQDCCESWGCDLVTKVEGEFDIIGSKMIDKSTNEDGDVQGKILLLVNTTKGPIKIWLWCNHNGYYAHEVIIKYGEGKIYKDNL